MPRCLVCDTPLDSGYFNHNKVVGKLCHRFSCKKIHSTNVRKAREARRAAEAQTQEQPHV